MSEQKPEAVLIDLSAVFRTAWHASEDSEIGYAVAESRRMITRAIGQRAGKLVAMCADGKGSFRKQLDPRYKANRDKQPATLYGALDQLKDGLLADGELIWEFEGFEGDDVIASACDAAVVAGHPVTVVTNDKDLLQLVKPGVRALRISTWDFVDVQWVSEKFGVPPVMLGDWLALTGDTADNVSGVPGVGPAAATAILKHFGNLGAFLASVATYGIAKMPPELSRWKSKLLAFAADKQKQADIVTGRKLIDLRYDVPLNWDDIHALRGPGSNDEMSTGTAIDADGYTDLDREQAASDAAKMIQEHGRVPNLDEQAKEARSEAHTPRIEVSEPKAPPPAPAPEPAKPTPGPPPLPPPVPPSVELQVLRERAAIENRQAAMAQFDSSMRPTGMVALYWLASRAIGTKSQKFRNEDEALMVMLRGMDFGVSPQTALDIFHVIEGKPCPPAALLITRAQEHPDCEMLLPVEMTNARAVYRVKHRKMDAPIDIEYTIEDANLAGLTRPTRSGQPSTWMKFPRDMLVKSAGLKAGRWYFPSTFLGAYAQEEMPGAE